MPHVRSKGLRIVVDFSDELVRQLSSARIDEIVRDYITNEALIDSAGAAKLLGISVDEFRSKHSKKIPYAEFGSGARGNRYRVKAVIEYRDKKTVFPKS